LDTCAADVAIPTQQASLVLIYRREIPHMPISLLAVVELLKQYRNFPVNNDAMPMFLSKHSGENMQ